MEKVIDEKDLTGLLVLDPTTSFPMAASYGIALRLLQRRIAVFLTCWMC